MAGSHNTIQGACQVSWSDRARRTTEFPPERELMATGEPIVIDFRRRQQGITQAVATGPNRLCAVQVELGSSLPLGRHRLQPILEQRGLLAPNASLYSVQ
jgi:hypothetical protein